MNAAQRRERILTRLNSAGAPLSASTLAAELGVSRQIVVGDVALLRAGGAQIDATPRGYQLHPAEKGYTGILACVHRTQEEMRRELYTVVDQGGTVVDVKESRIVIETGADQVRIELEKWAISSNETAAENAKAEAKKAQEAKAKAKAAKKAEKNQ